MKPSDPQTKSLFALPYAVNSYFFGFSSVSSCFGFDGFLAVSSCFGFDGFLALALAFDPAELSLCKGFLGRGCEALGSTTGFFLVLSFF